MFDDEPTGREGAGSAYNDDQEFLEDMRNAPASWSDPKEVLDAEERDPASPWNDSPR